MEPIVDEYEELPPGTSPFVNLTAGALAGIFEHTVTYPLDSLKTRLQSSHTQPSLQTELRQFTNRAGCARLWKGVWSVVIGAGPAHAIYFAAYEQSKQLLLQPGQDEWKRSLCHGASGAVATILSDAVMTPFDVVKQRLQLQQHRTILTCLRSLIKNEGIKSLYLSYPTTLLLNVPFHVIQFPVYEFMQGTLNPDQVYSPMVHCVAGGIAGGIAAAVTCPIDVLKTALQTRGLLPAPEAAQIKGITSAAQFILHRRGWTGLWAGVSPRILAHMPATAACWTIYEYFKMFLSAPHGE